MTVKRKAHGHFFGMTFHQIALPAARNVVLCDGLHAVDVSISVTGWGGSMCTPSWLNTLH